jgi:PadR family transcriptional regulator AphA
MQRNRTAYVILGILSLEARLSGYDIRKAVEDNFGSFWGESYGQIYPALKSLVAEKLIQPCPPAAAPGHRRQEYSIAEAGRACLREWLAAPFQNDPPRNEFMLKLFFAREAAPGVAIAHVRELQERNRRMISMLNAVESQARKHSSSNPNLPYWMLTLGLGVALTQAALDWSEEALKQLTEMELSRSKALPPSEEESAAASDGNADTAKNRNIPS